MTRKKRNLKSILFLIIILVILISILLICFQNRKEIIDLNENDIQNHYNQFVKTNKEAKIYELNDNNYKEVGFFSKDIELELLEINSNNDTKYFPIKNLNIYVYYEDVDPIDTISIKSDRYKNYITFNSNIVTNNTTNFYDENNKLLLSIDKSYNLPIIVKDDNRYGVEFNNELVYVMKDDTKNLVNSNNSSLKNSDGIPVLNYHFVYEDGDEGCKEEICHSATQIKQHFEYIKNNNYFTPTMKELEMYIDGKIQLPSKSVVVTFDDGIRADVAKKYIDMYQINATLFLITSWFDKEQFESEYMEVHSHGHDLHNTGVCPGGQGGAIKCMEENRLLEDLSTSRSKLNDTTVFCYPFYEYNEYSIDILKKAGFTMAFAGEYAGGKTKVTVGADKFRLPRWVIVNYTTFDLFKEYLS